MDFETHITTGEPKVLGLDSEYSGVLRIAIPLQPTANDTWVEIFNRGPGGMTFSLGMHDPEASPLEVAVQAPDGEVERYLAHVKDRVRLTNEEYNRDIAPGMKRLGEQAEAAKADEQRRIEEAQRKLSDAD